MMNEIIWHHEENDPKELTRLLELYGLTEHVDQEVDGECTRVTLKSTPEAMLLALRGDWSVACDRIRNANLIWRIEAGANRIHELTRRGQTRALFRANPL